MSNEVAVKNPDQVEVAEQSVSVRIYRPAVNVAERHDRLLLTAELPGVPADGLDITVEKRRLTIRADIKRDAPEGYEPVYTELPVGRYERSFTLSNVIEVESIAASFENGLLILTLPKVAKPEPRKITIQTG